MVGKITASNKKNYRIVEKGVPHDNVWVGCPIHQAKKGGKMKQRKANFY